MEEIFPNLDPNICKGFYYVDEREDLNWITWPSRTKYKLRPKGLSNSLISGVSFTEICKFFNFQQRNLYLLNCRFF